jgi:hypothetical protein
MFDAQLRFYEAQREDAKRSQDRSVELTARMNDAAINGGNLVLRTALLLNGGAVVSLLAFIATTHHFAIASTFLSFVWGIVSSLAGMGLAYGTHYVGAAANHSRDHIWDPPYVVPGRTTERLEVIHKCFHIGAVVAVVASLVFFVDGISDVRDAILRIKN